MKEENLYSGLLLLGPTGSGKTPLGDWLQQHGLPGRRCHHFDFGANFRAALAGGAYSTFLTHDDLSVIRACLASGALLTDAQFPIARKLLQAFLAEHAVRGDDIVVMNGLPRHTGQAMAVQEFLRIHWLVQLDCDTDVVLQRLRMDTGGDRKGRQDDGEALVQEKLAKYRDSTLPLVDWYRSDGAQIVTIRVEASMTQAAMWNILQREPCFGKGGHENQG